MKTQQTLLSITLILMICLSIIISNVNSTKINTNTNTNTSITINTNKISKRNNNNNKHNTKKITKLTKVKKTKKDDNDNDNDDNKPPKLNKRTNSTKPPAAKSSTKIQSSASANKKPPTQEINSLGLKVTKPMMVTKSPYTLERCDQIVALQADTILDAEDYTKRNSNYFTFTAYHANLFEGKSVGKLIKSILFTNMRRTPSEPLGAKNCLEIDGGLYVKAMFICLKTEEEFNNIQNLFTSLEQCRNGIGIGAPVSADKKKKKDGNSMVEVAKGCGMQGSSPDEMLKQSEKQLGEGEQDKGFWRPGGQRVPGTPQEESK